MSKLNGLRSRAIRTAIAVGVMAGATLAATLVIVSAPPFEAADAATTPSLAPTKPGRYVDTRTGEKTVDGRYAGIGRVPAGAVFAVTIAGRGDVPADAAAVMMNITAVRPDGPGHITVFPCGTPRPNVSSINYQGNDVAPNAVLSKLGTKGRVCLSSRSGTDVIVDVSAYVPAGGAPTSINPVRNIDTRVANGGTLGDNPGRLQGGKEYRFTIAGRSGVPANAAAAMMNITAVRPDEPGHVTVYPCGTARPTVSSINYRGGDVAPNAVLSKLGDSGQVCVYSVSGTDLLIDVNAYVPRGLSPSSIDPVRYVDTRRGEQTIDGKHQGSGRLVGGKEYKFAVAGRRGVPAKSQAAMLNITAVRPDGPGHVTVYPCGTPRPNVSSINYQGDDVAPNAVLAALGDGGDVCVYSLRNTDLIIDVNAFVGPSDPPTTPTTDAPNPDACVIGGKPVDTTVAAKECDALVAIYTSLGGPDWANNDGWNTPTDPCGWDLITCANGHVDSLVLMRNNMSGELPAAIGGLTYLKKLEIGDTGIEGAVPSTIGDLTNLTELWLHSPRLSGELPNSIGNLTNLEYLGVVRTQISGEIPDSIANLTKLVILQLFGNSMTGEIPSTIGNLPQLEVLGLSDNDFTGALPSNIGNLETLQELYASGNQMSGSIPDSIGDLTNLEVLDMSESFATGELPDSIGNLSKLRVLNLESSSLSGHIPGSIGNLANLRELGLRDNWFDGPIPDSIGNLADIDGITLSENDLSGEVPRSIINIKTTAVSLGGTGCLTTSDPEVLAWLERRDSSWDLGCSLG